MSKISALCKDLAFTLSPMKKCYYIGWLGRGNLGDEALYEAISCLFADRIKFYDKGYVGKVVNLLLKGHFDAVFLGGGTLINGSNFYLDQLNKVSGRKKVVFGTGVSDPEYWNTTENKFNSISGWVDLLESVDYLSVRGPRSKKILESWGVKREVNVIGDPALYFLRESIVRKKHQKVLGVNVGFTKNLLWGGRDDYLLEVVSKGLKVLSGMGWSFKFFPVVSGDLKAIDQVVNILPSDKVKIVSKFDDVSAYLSEMDEIDIFIGEKLHSVILSICSHTPSIMLEYRPKCRDFMESIDLGIWNIRTNEITDEGIVSLVSELYEKTEEMQDYIETTVRPMRDTLIAASNYISAFV